MLGMVLHLVILQHALHVHETSEILSTELSRQTYRTQQNSNCMYNHHSERTIKVNPAWYTCSFEVCNSELDNTAATVVICMTGKAGFQVSQSTSHYEKMTLVSCWASQSIAPGMCMLIAASQPLHGPTKQGKLQITWHW